MAYIGVSPSNGVRRKHTYTATANQTSFSGAGAEGATLSYNDSNFVDVYQNGVKLSEADYTSTSGTAIVLAQGASVSDIVEVVVYDVFSVSDTVSKSAGGTFDGNITAAGTLGVTGVVTANAGVVVDEMTLDGDTLTATDTFTIDAAGDITLDADGADIRLSDAGTQFGKFTNSSSDFVISSSVNDKDMIFKGADGGADITALTLDMSDAGSALFNHDVKVPDNGFFVAGAGSDLRLSSDGTNGTIDTPNGNITVDSAGEILLDSASGTMRFKVNGTSIGEFYNDSSDFLIRSAVSDKDMKFQGNDGGSTITALTLDMSNAGAATFNKKIIVDAANGVAANDFVGSFTNREETSGESFGVSITAGTSGSDIALNVINTAADTVLMRVHGNGTTTIGNSLTLTDGNLVVADGHGVNFAATSDGTGTDTSELFDDYEEGTFTPSFTTTNTGFSSLGYSHQNGFYTKVGRKVSIHIQLIVNTTPSGANGDLKIAGLPYTGASTAQHGPGVISFYNAFTSQTNQATALVYLDGASTALNVAFQEFSGASGFANTPATALHNANPRLTCQIDYFV